MAGTIDEDSNDFISSFDRALKVLHIRMFLGRFQFLRGQDTRMWSDVARVHAFVDKYIDMAMERKRSSEKASEEKANYIFLDELLKMTEDIAALRNQMLNIFLPSRDSAASTISFIFFQLARYPEVWSRLRQEVLDIGEEPLTFDLLKSITYLRYVIN